MQTVLFFDEANTTEDIGLIKEIMCDLTIKGAPLSDMHELKLIAAGNPYRKYDLSWCHYVIYKFGLILNSILFGSMICHVYWCLFIHC